MIYPLAFICNKVQSVFTLTDHLEQKKGGRGGLCYGNLGIFPLFSGGTVCPHTPSVISTSSSALKKMILFSDHLLLEPCRTECRLRPGAETQPAEDADCGFALRQCNNRTLCCAGVC
jgi:hypothetical protein